MEWSKILEKHSMYHLQIMDTLVIADQHKENNLKESNQIYQHMEITNIKISPFHRISQEVESIQLLQINTSNNLLIIIDKSQRKFRNTYLIQEIMEDMKTKFLNSS